MSHCTQWHSLRLLLDQSTFGLGWIVTWIGPEGVPRGHSGSWNNFTQASPPGGPPSQSSIATAGQSQGSESDGGGA